MKQLLIDFIMNEYHENFEHKRHFEQLRQRLLIQYFTILLALAILSVGLKDILNLLKEPKILAIPLGIFYLFGLFLYIMLIKNRQYAVKITRQINKMRVYFIEFEKQPTLKSLFQPEYLRGDLPKALNFKSDTFIIFCMMNFFNSISFGLVLYFLFNSISFGPVLYFLNIQVIITFLGGGVSVIGHSLFLLMLRKT